MRKLILFVLATVMLAGGTWLAVAEVLFDPVIHLRFAFGGAVLALGGGYLIWVDFVAPRLGIRTWED